MTRADAVLLVAHGSRSAQAMKEMSALSASVAELCRPAEVRIGYLELCDPAATEVAEKLLAGGATEIVVAPLMLHAAGHTKSDVPAVVVEARARHPHARIHYARPLGTDHALLSLARRHVREARGLGLPLALFSRGSSDPDANAEAYKVGRLLADMTGAPLVASGFSGITWPSVAETLDQLRRLGAHRIAALAWFIATGVLIERMRQEFDAFSADTGVEVVDCGYLGTGPELAALLAERVEEALSGRAAANCDACAYRRPFPGLEDRVGMAIGTGHSHLAAEHRSHHS
ncbi:MAG: sirohydrochlorin chelatase [Acidimicrobiales bacterium]